MEEVTVLPLDFARLLGSKFAKGIFGRRLSVLMRTAYGRHAS